MANKCVRFLCAVMACCAIVTGRVWAQSLAVRDRPETSVHASTVSVDVQSAPLMQVLRSIARQAGLSPFYTNAVVNRPARVTMHVQAVPPDVAFAVALRGTGLTAAIVDGKVLFRREEDGSAGVTQGSVAGRVIDAKTKQGARGATVTLDDKAKGVVSGNNGEFRFSNVAPGEHTLRIRLLGYVKATRPVTVIDGQVVSVDVVLEPSVSALDQVIVTGTIVATAQREVPNAMTVITAKDIEQRGITHIDQLFRGDVPGVFAANQGSGSPLDQVLMFSRGVTALTTASAGTYLGTNPIKTYVDGVELADPSYLSQIDPKSIERIEILTGPQASTMYGSNAINGVMQIFTKRGSTANRPQFTATLLSGWVENDFSTARTPQHDDAAQVNGVEGHWAYNAGGSWIYVGPWTPSKQTSRLSGFGGARIQRGPITADGSLRLATTRNRQHGAQEQLTTAFMESGWYMPSYAGGVAPPKIQTLVGQTLGLTLGFAPVSWWSHELVVGDDRSSTEVLGTAPGFLSPFNYDTIVGLIQGATDRRSLRYASTVQVPLASMARAVVTVGADGWQSLSTSLNVSAPRLTGTLTSSGTPTVTRQPGHNAGGFLQAQMGLWDQLFVTYGLRGEWNPTYGDEAQPNWAPRYGVAYTRDVETPVGPVTMKLRGSYGRSTRPPSVGAKAATKVSASNLAGLANILFIPYYGDYDDIVANPELAPEYQQGGEGGLELYFGRRGSLVVTRYNQTVDGLISQILVDSVRSLDPSRMPIVKTSCDAMGYCYYGQYQNLNVANIRNQGWELTGTMVTGPVTTRGTYSWTKSRTIGVNPQYRALFPPQAYPQYQPGASLDNLPEHTWSGGVTYARGASMVALNLSGTGMLHDAGNLLYFTSFNNSIRLPTNLVRMSLGLSEWPHKGYVLADLNVSQRFSSRVEGVLQVQNLGDTYHNDVYDAYATLGRQTKLGFRLR